MALANVLPEIWTYLFERETGGKFAAVMLYAFKMADQWREEYIALFSKALATHRLALSRSRL